MLSIFTPLSVSPVINASIFFQARERQDTTFIVLMPYKFAGLLSTIMRRIQSLPELDTLSYCKPGGIIHSMIVHSPQKLVDSIKQSRKAKSSSRSRSESAASGADRLQYGNFFAPASCQEMATTPAYKEISQVLGKTPALWIRYVFTITLPLGRTEQLRSTPVKRHKNELARASSYQSIIEIPKISNYTSSPEEKLAKYDTAFPLSDPVVSEFGLDHLFVMVGDACIAADRISFLEFRGELFDLTWTWEAVEGHFMKTIVNRSMWESGRSHKPVFTGKTTSKTNEEIWAAGWCYLYLYLDSILTGCV